MRRVTSGVSALALMLAPFGALAQISPGGGGGSGGGTVTSIATSCGVSGGTITTTGTIYNSFAFDNQTGTTVTPTAAANCGGLITMTNAGAIAVSLVAANWSATSNYFNFKVSPGSVGSATFTPTTGTIDGAASEVFAPGSGGTAIYDSNTGNWTTSGRYVVGPGGSTTGNLAQYNGASGQVLSDSGVLATNVVQGPASSTNNNCAKFNGAGGKLIADSGGPCGFQPVASYKSGNWFRSMGIVGAASAATNLAVSNVYCHPWVVSSQGMTAQKIGGVLGVLGAGGNASFALFKSDGTGGLPGTRIDYLATPVSTGTTTPSGTFAGTTAAVPTGMNWACTTTDNTTLRFISIPANTTNWSIQYMGGSTLATTLNTATTVAGITCAAATTCGGAGFSAWSAGAFTWGTSLSGATWSEVTATIVPEVVLQAN